MVIRGHKKAYDENDELKSEYSVTLYGNKYPLMSKNYKGFTNKNTSNGGTQFAKIFHGSEHTKRDYIKCINSVLNMCDAEAVVGDDSTNQFKDVSSGKEDTGPPIKVKSNVDLVPDSIEVFQKEIEGIEEESADDEQHQYIQQQRKEGAKQEKKDEDKQKRLDDLLNLNKEKKEKSKQYKSEDATYMTPEKEIPKKYKWKKKMKRGGMATGPSHQEGGITMNINKNPNDQVELEGGEYVVNKESSKHFAPQLAKMNRAGNELRDDPRNPEKQRRIEQIKRKMKLRRGGKVKYADGGSTSDLTQPQNTGGIMGKLSQDDGKEDIGMYQYLISKYFSQLDWTRTLKYIKIKNKKLESKNPQELLQMSQDIAQELKIQLKYNGTEHRPLLKQLYELKTLELGFKKSEPEDKKDFNNIGAIVDLESIFGEGSELDKEAFAEKYYKNGGQIKKKYRQGGNTFGKEDLNPDSLGPLTTAGKNKTMTDRKPEQSPAFQAFKQMGSEPDKEGPISSESESQYTRKQFDLAYALQIAEQGWTGRNAEKIKTKEDLYGKGGIFRISKPSTQKKRHNLN